MIWNKTYIIGWLILVSLGGMATLQAADTADFPVVPQPAELTHIRQVLQPEMHAMDFDGMLRRYQIPSANVSLYIRDLNAARPLLQHNATVARNPASTMKLLTTWTALKLLGPAFTWKTELWARGEVQQGVLKGDLVIKGYGDPFLTDEAFSKMLQDLRLKGIEHIEGDLLIDNSYFDIPNYDPAAFDNEPTRVYNAPPSALMFNFQASRFLFEPDTNSNKVGITPFPLIPGLQLENSMVLTKGNCKRSHYRPKFRQQGQSIKVTGQYAVACGKNFIMRVLSAPEIHVFNAFRDIWQTQGGRFNGQLKQGQVAQSDQLIHTYESRTLGEQIRFVNKWSNNVMARHLFLTAGAQTLGGAATIDKGLLAMASVLEKAGINYQGMAVENGSGLSRKSRISALQLGQLLEAVWRDPYMPEFLASMPLLGEDGTLASRFRKEDLRGRAHMKTGTLRDVTALAGYMLTRSGKRLVIVIQHNGSKAAKQGRKLQNAILRWAFEL